MIRLPERLPTQLRHASLGRGPVVVRAHRVVGDVEWWIEGRGRDVAEASAQCSGLCRVAPRRP